MLLFAAQLFFHLAIAFVAPNFIIPTHNFKRSPIQFSRKRSASVMDLSLLPQIIQELEQHENSLRLKKLLLYVCKRVWQNDLTVIEQANWQDYIQELINKNPTVERLKRNVYGMAKTTNKPKQYILIADTLISYIEKIYFIDEVTQANIINSQAGSSKLNKAYDPWQLKLVITASVNPLKAKIFIFYSLYEQFDFSERDWVNLRAQQLDDLLQNLFDLYPTFSELKKKLEDTANIMEDLGGNLQIAQTISQAFRPYYA